MGGKGVAEDSVFYGSIWPVALYRPLGFSETGELLPLRFFISLNSL